MGATHGCHLGATVIIVHHLPPAQARRVLVDLIPASYSIPRHGA